jgi:hypothetical protein
MVGVGVQRPPSRVSTTPPCSGISGATARCLLNGVTLEQVEEGELRLKNLYLTLEASAKLSKFATKNAAASTNKLTSFVWKACEKARHLPLNVGRSFSGKDARRKPSSGF